MKIIFFLGFILAFTNIQAQNQITFQGQKFSASAPCEGSNNFSITTENGLVIVVVNSPDAGSTEVNDKFFTEDCVTCPIVQVMTPEGQEFRAISGTLLHEGNKIGFKVMVQLSTDDSVKAELSGEVVCTQE